MVYYGEHDRGSEDNREVEIKNKDIPILTDTLSIMKSVEMIEQRREWQHDRLYHMTQYLTGMPGARNPKGLDDIYAVLSEVDEEHKSRCRDYAKKLKKIQKILDGIESQSMRTFVTMKYVMDISDAEIRRELNLTRRGFDRAKSSIETAPRMAAVKWQERYILAQDD